MPMRTEHNCCCRGLLFKYNYLYNPPAQNSPKNILNILNDFCIQSIFRYLNLQDIINVANVCTNFRENAQGCFALMFKTIDMYNNPTLDFKFWSTNNNARLSSEQQLNLLQNFGHLIYGIRIGYSRFTNDPIFLNSIREFCGTSLAELSVSGDFTNSSMLAPFPITNFGSDFPFLKMLNLMHIELKNPVFGISLEELQLSHLFTENFKTCIRAYPELLTFEFSYILDDSLEGQDHLKDRNHPFLQFLDLNPQIFDLNVYSLLNGAVEDPRYDDVTLKDIHDRLPNLNSLDCDSFRSFDNDSPIFQQLEQIYVEKIEEIDLIWISKNIANLGTIRVVENKNLNLQTYLDVLKLVKDLEFLYLDDMIINAEDYYSILRSIRMRSKPCFVRVEEIRDVSSDIIDANSEWINTVLN